MLGYRVACIGLLLSMVMSVQFAGALRLYGTHRAPGALCYGIALGALRKKLMPLEFNQVLAVVWSAGFP